MPQKDSYVNHGAYLDTNVDADDSAYNDVGLSKDSDQYEELDMPDTLGKATDESNSRSRRPQPTPVQTAGPPGGSTQNNNNCCRRPPCWGWVLIVIGTVIAVTVVAILAFLLTSTTSTDSLLSNGYSTATTPIPIYRDCLAAYNDGQTKSGVFQISPDGVTKKDVRCEQELDGGGWTVFQRRMDGTVKFSRNWYVYKSGFGSIDSEFWLGNDIIHLMTVNEDQKMKVELEHDGLTAYANYSLFWIEDEGGKYRLHIGGFSSGQNNPGDSLNVLNGRDFSTYDRDHDTDSGNCAAVRDSAWWYADCTLADLNGLYGSGYYQWVHWSGHASPLTASRMMLKTK